MAKFWQGYSQISSLSNAEKFLVGQNSDGKTVYAEISQLGIDNVRAIAEGRFNAIVFDDSAQLQAWLAGSYPRPDGVVPADLVIGQNIYLQSLTEDDYWVSNLPVQTINDLSVLPDDKIDLSDYVQKSGTDRLMTADEGTKLAGIESGAQVNAAPVANLNSTDDTLPLAASQGKILADKIPYLITIKSVNTAPDGSGNFQIATGLKLSNLITGATAANVTSSIIFDNQTTDIINGKNLICSIIIENDYIFICGLTTMSAVKGDFYISFRIN